MRYTRVVLHFQIKTDITSVGKAVGISVVEILRTTGGDVLQIYAAIKFTRLEIGPVK